MQDPLAIVGTIADVFTGVGIVGAAAFGIFALLLTVTDGTWLPARAVVEQVDDGHVVRWIDDVGEVNEAPLSPAELAKIGGRDMADIFFRRGWQHRMRLTRQSPAARACWWLATGFAALGALSLVGSWVLLAAAG